LKPNTDRRLEAGNAQISDCHDGSCHDGRRLDRSGGACAIGAVGEIGGGLLGIEAKSVAIDMSAFDVVPAGRGRNDNNNPSAATANDLSSVKLKVAWTKDELKSAPEFQYYKPRTRAMQPPATTGAAPTIDVQPLPQTE
jgi:hypothetical protein